MQDYFSVHIRYATPDDAKMLSELGARTFYDTFAKDNTAEDIALHLKKSFSPEIQFSELSAPNMIYLVADLDQEPAGFAQLILDSTDSSLKGSKSLEIRRIYAIQEYLGRGVGKGLMNACIQEAKQRGCDSLWLGVWEKNPRAIAFYKKWGFEEVGTHVFTVGKDPQRDFIMELELS